MSQLFSNTLTFEVLDAIPRVRTGIELRVYEPDGQTFLDVLPDTGGRQWVEVLNEAGSGQFTMQWGHEKANPENLRRGNTVRCYLDGVLRFAFRIGNKKLKLVDVAGVPTPGWEVSGQGTAMVLNNGVVYPEGGVGRLASDPRLVTFVSSNYDPATVGFTAATGIGTFASPPNSSWQPEDWPDSSGIWIAGQAYSVSMTPGDTYFVRDIVVPAGADLRFHFAGDDTFTVWFAGSEILRPDRDVDAFRKTYYADVKDVPGGTYRVAVRLRNLGGTSGLLGAIYTLDVEGELDTLLWRTNGTDWLTLLDPATPPGLTPGGAVKLLIEEAQARGSCSQVQLGFDDATDSAGVPWDATFDVGLTLGTSLYDVMLEMAEYGYDWQMTADNRLLMWRDGRGIDRSQQTSDSEPMLLAPGDLLLDGSLEEDGDVVNSLLLQTPDGWTTRERNTSINEWERVEGYLSLGNATNNTEAFRSADAALDEQANPRWSGSFDVLDREGAIPYVDWRVGDWVLAPQGRDEYAAQRVRSLAVSEDSTGNPKFTPELATLTMERTEAHQRWLKRMSNGTLGGMSASAAPNRTQSGTLTGRSGGTSTSGTSGSTGTTGTGTATNLATAVVAETVPGATPDVGVGEDVARGDHTHGTPPVPTAADVGAAETDHTHEFDGDVVILQEVYTVLEVTQAEYDALTPDANTLYLIV